MATYLVTEEINITRQEGDKVTWECTVADNVWAPDVYGWVVV